MNSANNFFPSNLKVLRTNRNMSQDAIANELGLSRVKYSSWENNFVKSFSLDDVIMLADFFKVSIDTITRVDLSGMGPFQLKQYIASDAYSAGENLRILTKTVNNENRENVELVSKKGKAGYFSGYNDPEYISTLPVFNLPMLPENGSFRMFAIEGESMLPFPKQMHVLASYVSNWSDLNDGQLCVVVLRSVQEILFKAVIKHQAEKGVYILRSYNREFPDQLVSAKDIQELWKFKAFYSEQEMEPLDDLSQQVSALRAEFRNYMKSGK